jgi:hypothetical protein
MDKAKQFTAKVRHAVLCRGCSRVDSGWQLCVACTGGTVTIAVPRGVSGWSRRCANCLLRAMLLYGWAQVLHAAAHGWCTNSCINEVPCIAHAGGTAAAAAPLVKLISSLNLHV